MKKSLLAMLLGACVAGNAAAETYDFSYGGEVEDYLGLQAADTYDVAICLPGNLFEGFRIKQIDARINAAGGVSAYTNPSLWLSDNLGSTAGYYTPGIASYPVTIASDGLLSTTLPEDYTITADGVYVGYTVTVSTLNNATKYPMGFFSCDDSNAFFCRTRSQMPVWSNLASSMGVGAAISVVLESDDMPARSVSIAALPSAIYMKVGEPGKATVDLVSSAADPVDAVDIEYVIEGQSYSQAFTLPEQVPAGLNKQFSVDMEIPAVDHKLKEDVMFNVTKVNGQVNEAKNPAASTFLGVLEEVPVHQTLIEEYTGTWCGWCTRGYAALEYIKENEPDFVVAAFHNSDPMQITTNYPVSPDGFPYATLNRQIGGDPYWMSDTQTQSFHIVDEVKALNAQPTPWGIKVSHTWENENTLVAHADVWNVLGYEDGDYAIAYLLVADGLSGKTSSWSQTNNYASYAQNSNNIPQLNQFCRGGDYGKSRVSGLTFNDVVVSTNGIYGVEESIPTSLVAEEVVSHSLSFDLSAISSKLIPDRKKLRVIAAVLDRNGFVVNCAKNEVNDEYDPSGVDGLTDENAPVEYYNLNGVRVAEPAHGIFIRRQGAKAEKVIIR